MSRHGHSRGSAGDVTPDQPAGDDPLPGDGWGSVTRLDVDIDDQGPIDLAVGRPEARIMVPLGEPTGAAAISAYDEFVEVRTKDGSSGFGIIEQGILRQLD